MTGFNNNNNNKFVPTAPKTYTVIELRDQQQQPVKKSPLSAAARSKVVNRSGSNYLSENKGYGPCIFGNSNCSITATLIDTDGHAQSDTLYQPVYFGEGGVIPWVGDIEYGWGKWESRYCLIKNNANSFTPSYRARQKLVEEILKIKDQCGHKAVSVTDKKEWN